MGKLPGLLMFVVASVCLSACGSSSPPAATEAETETAAVAPSASSEAPPSVPPTAAPPYTVVGQLQWRSDGEPTYYVAIEPVDLSNDGFKQTVKLVTQALAEKDGDTDFSAKFYDDQAIASEALASDPGSGNTTPEDKATLDIRGQHLVAIYGGGLEAALYPYEIMWYPGASTDTPNVGQWVDSEEWKPQ